MYPAQVIFQPHRDLPEENPFECTLWIPKNDAGETLTTQAQVYSRSEHLKDNKRICAIELEHNLKEYHRALIGSIWFALVDSNRKVIATSMIVQPELTT